MKQIKSVGKYSYYACPIQIHTFYEKNVNSEIHIGNFTSIAHNCHMFLSDGDHYKETGTNSPFHTPNWDVSHRKIRKYPSKGNIIIGNDVWIGANVHIKHGVTVGDGAIIAANSNVIKNVPAYSIYGGNPAKFIKYRFEKDIIDKFLQIQWWKYSDDDINRILPLLEKIPSIEILEEIESRLNGGIIDTFSKSKWHEIQINHFKINNKYIKDESLMWSIYLDSQN